MPHLRHGSLLSPWGRSSTALGCTCSIWEASRHVKRGKAFLRVKGVPLSQYTNCFARNESTILSTTIQASGSDDWQMNFETTTTSWLVFHPLHRSVPLGRRTSSMCLPHNGASPARHMRWSARVRTNVHSGTDRCLSLDTSIVLAGTLDNLICAVDFWWTDDCPGSWI